MGGKPDGETMKETMEREFKGNVKWAEIESRDTAENAVYSARILKADGIARIALISNAWHLPRATALFERQGMEVLPAPTIFSMGKITLFAELLPSSDALDKSATALHEWLGILVQRFTK